MPLGRSVRMNSPENNACHRTESYLQSDMMLQGSCFSSNLTPCDWYPRSSLSLQCKTYGRTANSY